MKICVKRIYEAFSASDDYRILVDRLWPRGITKENAHIDKWLKDIAPSTELRKWFDHDPEKWEEFKGKYHLELKDAAAVGELLNDVRKHQVVTLLFAAKERHYNHAIVLQQFINEHLPA